MQHLFLKRRLQLVMQYLSQDYYHLHVSAKGLR